MEGWTGSYCNIHGRYEGSQCPKCAIMALLPKRVDELEKLAALLELQNQELNGDLERWVQRVIKLEAWIKEHEQSAR